MILAAATITMNWAFFGFMMLWTGIAFMGGLLLGKFLWQRNQKK